MVSSAARIRKHSFTCNIFIDPGRASCCAPSFMYKLNATTEEQVWTCCAPSLKILTCKLRELFKEHVWTLTAEWMTELEAPHDLHTTSIHYLLSYSFWIIFLCLCPPSYFFALLFDFARVPRAHLLMYSPCFIFLYMFRSSLSCFLLCRLVLLTFCCILFVSP